jgi:DNA-binding SARP family transcriptional activator
MTLYKKLSETAEGEADHYSLSGLQYRASFFGPFRVTRNEQPLGEPTWRRNKARTLLKWFLLNPQDLFSVEQLSKLFWPDIAEKVAVSNLHVTLHYLRHVLEPELAPGSPSTFVRRNRHNYYHFDLRDNWWTDVFEVQRLSASAKEAELRGELVRALALYDQLISYYRLEFLPEDIYEDIFSPYRRQHEYAYTQLLEHLLQLYTQTERFDEAISYALLLLAVDPYNENAVKAMVKFHLQQGNAIGAIRQLDDFQRDLKQELGIEPGKEMLTLRNNILKVR